MRLTIPCRLCGGAAERRFQLIIMNSIECGYYECPECGSLETTEPSWLDAAYAADTLPLDGGRVQRNLLNSTICPLLISELGLPGGAASLDWGAGDGLFVRLMRDRGHRFHGYDRYEDMRYSRHFSVADPTVLQPAVVTCFEVFEHLPYPSREVAAIFDLSPDVLIFSTELYERQGPDWMYLSPITGRHVFFYSRKALDWMTARFGYRYFPLMHLHVMVKPSGTANVEAMDRMAAAPAEFLQNAALRLAAHLTDPYAWRHVMADHAYVLSLIKAKSA
jgi:hypothetical protein